MLLGSTAKPYDNLGVEMPGLGSALAVQTLVDEVRSKDPLLVFLVETKSGESKMKGIQNKLD